MMLVRKVLTGRQSVAPNDGYVCVKGVTFEPLFGGHSLPHMSTERDFLPLSWKLLLRPGTSCSDHFTRRGRHSYNVAGSDELNGIRK